MDLEKHAKLLKFVFCGMQKKILAFQEYTSVFRLIAW
jgi:hypothetical protein